MEHEKFISLFELEVNNGDLKGYSLQIHYKIFKLFGLFARNRTIEIKLSDLSEKRNKVLHDILELTGINTIITSGTCFAEICQISNRVHLLENTQFALKYQSF